jgi:hypothetical protein
VDSERSRLTESGWFAQLSVLGGQIGPTPSLATMGEIMSRWAMVKIVLSGFAVSTALTLAYVLIAVGLSG